MFPELTMPDNPQDAFYKYMSIFSARLVQSLVQSRQGEYSPQPCVPITETHRTSEWFNLKIDELGEIAAHLKSSVKQYPPFAKLTVEFVLYTSEGQFLPLEAWVLRVDEEETDDRINLDNQYHSLSVLLRSVNVAARMTPMHRLYVKKQNSESFIVMYRIYTSDGISDMGKNSRSRQIARLPSVFGTVYLDLIYRTSMHFDYKEKEEEVKKEKHQPVKPPLDDCTPILSKKFQSEPRLSTSSAAPEVFDELFTHSQNFSKKKSISEDNQDAADLAYAKKVPFGSLLQSAYAPIESSPPADKSPEPSDIPGKASTAPEITAIPEEDEEKLQKSEDSFIELCGFGSSTGSTNVELGELLNSLKIAPDIQAFATTSEEIQKELSSFSDQLENFQAFVEHINKCAE